MTEAYSKMT